MNTDWKLAQHLNYTRQTYTKSAVRRVPDVAYNVYKKSYEEPKKSEGFTTIEAVEFIPDFENKQHELIFKQWTSLV